MNNEDVKNKSLYKALQILNCFTRKKELGVTEISEELGLYKSNVHNILDTFKKLEYVEQNEETGKYRLGIAVARLSRALGDSFSITKIALPYMQEIANISNERVYLGIPRGDEVFYLDATYPSNDIQMMRSLLGETAKMYCTGIGKAMMAYLPAGRVEGYLKEPLERFTETTIADPEKLREELQLIRNRGYAIDNMEHELGVKCVGVPIFDKNGNIYAAMSISGPSLRFTDERIEELYKMMKTYIRIIQDRIV